MATSIDVSLDNLVSYPVHLTEELEIQNLKFIEQQNPDLVQFDFVPEKLYQKASIPPSLNFSSGSFTVDIHGKYYKDLGTNLVDLEDNVVGDFDPITGEFAINSWLASTDNNAKLVSMLLQSPPQPISNIVFRTPINPIKPNSLRIFLETILFGDITITFDDQGYASGPGYVKGYADFKNGVVTISLFYQRVLSDNPVILQEFWYRGDNVYVRESDGKNVIDEPIYFKPDTIRYDAVGFTYLPLDPELIGLDTVRLPTDGRVRYVDRGDVGAITEKRSLELSASQPLDAFDVGDVRLTSLDIYDSNGLQVDPETIEVNLESGIGSLLATYVAADYVPPLTARFRVMDMFLIVQTDISGRVDLSVPLTRNYTENAVFSNALITNNQQARSLNAFSQKSWTSVWSDNLIGDPATAQYQIANNPIIVTNRSCIQERWALVFTSSTAFRVIGEKLGQIAVGDTGQDLNVINPVTGQPYFTILSSGWGQGWSAGNVFRHNTKSASPPVWLGMAIQQHQASTQDTYEFGIEVHGNVDR